jgi:hypothetical protein
MLEIAERVFPIAAMGDDFKGAHHVTIGREDGMLRLCVWHEGKCQWIAMETAEDEADASELERCCRVLRENWGTTGRLS